MRFALTAILTLAACGPTARDTPGGDDDPTPDSMVEPPPPPPGDGGSQVGCSGMLLSRRGNAASKWKYCLAYSCNASTGSVPAFHPFPWIDSTHRHPIQSLK